MLPSGRRQKKTAKPFFAHRFRCGQLSRYMFSGCCRDCCRGCGRCRCRRCFRRRCRRCYVAAAFTGAFLRTQLPQPTHNRAPRPIDDHVECGGSPPLFPRERAWLRQAHSRSFSWERQSPDWRVCVTPASPPANCADARREEKSPQDVGGTRGESSSGIPEHARAECGGSPPLFRGRARESGKRPCGRARRRCPKQPRVTSAAYSSSR